tara:strand:+ start:12400 stop:12600 length:201 start_codon:yes stop_codon:yes gene_type:complete
MGIVPRAAGVRIYHRRNLKLRIDNYCFRVCGDLISSRYLSAIEVCLQVARSPVFEEHIAMFPVKGM